MAAPSITSRVRGHTTIGLPYRYVIHASNFPTSYDTTDLVDGLVLDAATGIISGTVTDPGLIGSNTYEITAINDDGSGTADFELIVKESSGGVGGDDITVLQGKFWADQEERLDYADLDAAGHVIASFNPDSIGEDQLVEGAIVDKVSDIGGPGLIGQFTFNSSYTRSFQGITLAIPGAAMQAPGVLAGDIVIVDEILWPDDELIDPPYNCTFFGVASDSLVTLYSYSRATIMSIPAQSRINFRVFGLPNG